MDEVARGPEPHDVWLRAGLAGAILFIFVSMAVVCFILPFHRYPSVFEELGMVELPWLTGFFISFIRGFRAWWWAIGAGCIVLAALSWKGWLGKTGWKPIAAIFLMAVILPGLAYLAMEMPIVEFKKALDKSQ